MTTTEKIDAALDSVLAACGSDLKTVHENTRHYKPSTKDDMREAMRKIMAESYSGEILKLEQQLRFVNIASHSLAALLCGLQTVSEKDGYELIRRESVLKHVLQWRKNWDVAMDLAGSNDVHEAMKGKLDE